MSTGRGLDAGGLKYRLGISQFATKDRVVAFIFSFFFQDDMGNEALMRSLIHARWRGVVVEGWVVRKLECSAHKREGWGNGRVKPFKYELK